jgi:hypothetical protein
VRSPEESLSVCPTTAPGGCSVLCWRQLVASSDHYTNNFHVTGWYSTTSFMRRPPVSEVLSWGVEALLSVEEDSEWARARTEAGGGRPVVRQLWDLTPRSLN